MRCSQIDIRDRDDNKEVSLTTSKINYMDPRVSVAWCKRHEVPVEKVRMHECPPRHGSTYSLRRTYVPACLACHALNAKSRGAIDVCVVSAETREQIGFL